jgi:hypothetical protein
MAERKNIIGEKYNKLTIVEDAPSTRQPSGRLIKRVNVKCDCGNTKNNVAYVDLKKNKVKSCGCLSVPKIEINTGDSFGFWKVLSEGKGRTYDNDITRTVICECFCGTIKDIILQSLVRGISKSCGCQGKIREEKIKKEKILPQDTEEEQWKQSINYPEYYISNKSRLFHYKSQTYTKQKRVHKRHGKSTINLRDEIYKTFIKNFDSELYKLIEEEGELKLIEHKTKRYKKLKAKYTNINSRCTHDSRHDYHNYGGRGIKVEESFNTFYKFFMWSISNGYEEGLEIDRIDNNGNYSADNCRFVDRKTNCRNTRCTKLSVEIVEEIRSSSLSIKELAEKFDCSSTTIDSVLKNKSWV